jgi:primary-amine oxidase
MATTVLDTSPFVAVPHVGFMLKPVGFFDGNPALDLPPSASCSHCGGGACTCGHSATDRGLPVAREH